MKIRKGPKDEVVGIDFCCGAMGKSILLREIVTSPWTDHDLCFRIHGTGGINIAHCPHCGAEVKTTFEPRKK